MGPFLIFSSLCLLNVISCYDSDSSPEISRVEYGPLYETIIFSDIADIIKDFENNMNSPLDAFINTDDSGSDEKIEDLLSEYQHYLEKAHKQRRNYLEKSKMKNKVPLFQRERYSKNKPSQPKRDDYYTSSINYYGPDTMQFPQSQFKTPLDFLIPVNMMKSRFYDNFEPVSTNSKSTKKPLFEKADENILQLPPAFPSAIRETIQSSCYCETDTLPCECGCQQCLLPFESTQRKYSDYEKKMLPSIAKQISNDNSVKDLRSLADNTLNIRIKIDVQFPTPQESIHEMVKNTSNNDKFFDHGNSISKESNINVPFPYFNFPVPLEMFGFKRVDQDTQPIHKITIHRKKKSKSNSNGKRHRKKVITFHNIKIDPHHIMQPNYDEKNNASDYHQNLDTFNQMNPSNKTTNLTQKMAQEHINETTNKTEGLITSNDTKTDDSIYLMVNIRNNADNITEDTHRNENSIEADYTKGFLNASTEEPLLRDKRDVSSITKSATDSKKTESGLQINSNAQENNTMKKTDKVIPDDNNLLYWPLSNKIASSVHSKNITTLILDTENKKVKLNLSTESIRHNRTRALEQAIFGQVDWEDVGTVAPVFMSFMGKYIRGVLTFCSEKICHSMKCAEKVCIHRTCAPDERINNKGHCSGSNATDSVASMEAIMDLPSNVALEIVDILQDRMLGKLYGKVTICIGSKCVSFVASKKIFIKSKCTSKDLNETGHCPNIKNVKIM